MGNKPMLIWHKPQVNRLIVSLDTRLGAGTSVDNVTGFGGPQQSVISTTVDFAGG